YVLDKDGVCHFVMAPEGGPAPGTDRAIGAQFVACIDAREPGQLVGELRLGATALFACHDGGRYLLLRSPPIEWVEQRGAAHGSEFGETTARLPAEEPAPSLPWSEFRPETAAIAREFEGAGDPSLDVEEIVTYSEVTLTMPLYRPDAQRESPQLRAREALSRGERLR
ncbi:MAG TPA: hypothetical protein VHB21_15460, partial [Minicystis sp.]|nr:hypothetical protein [Minicystis sp.]